VQGGNVVSKKILVIEDNDKNRMLIRDILQYHAYEVIEAENGKIGVELAIKHLPDLILMDIQMPVMDGFAAIALLKDDPDTKSIKVLALTSFAMKGDKEKIMQAGFDDYIAKPIDTRKLPEIVKKYLAT
jgi:two-component system cell cycle response regulator DivK